MTAPTPPNAAACPPFGRHEARPRLVDPLADQAAPLRWWQRTRLKEWVGFLVVHPEWSSSFILQDAKYLASSDFFAHHTATDRLDHHQAVGPPGSLRLPADLADATVAFSRKGYRIEFSFGGDGGTHHLRFAIDKDSQGEAVAGELVLDGAAASAPLSVHERLPKGTMYTWKQIFPVSGNLRVGDTRITYDATRDFAIVDEHRSLLPYRTDWTWGTFAFRDDTGIVGANFATRPHREGQVEESALWSAMSCEPLTDVTFTPKSDDPAAPWHIASADGRLDVTFTPLRRNTVDQQLGVFAVDYFMMYDTYRGTMRGSDGLHEVRDVHGVCEKMHARL